MAILGPFSVGYPVAFRSGGDTTKEAFGKHIQEIEKIYGILNALDADKIAASEFTTKVNALNDSISNVQSTLQNNLNSHINSTSPHPNWKVDLGSQVTGSLSGSRIAGDLSGATIDKAKVTGLEEYVTGLVKEDFVCHVSPHTEGYVDFNQLQIRFGRVAIEDVGGGTDPNEKAIRTVNFLKSFTTHTAVILLGIEDDEGVDEVTQNKDWAPMVHRWSASYFNYHIENYSGLGNVAGLYLHYIAIGH